jgi:protein SCO1
MSMKESELKPSILGLILPALAPAALVLWAGCGRSSAPGPAVSPSKNAAATIEPAAVTAYKLVGVVRRVDPKRGEVTIHHAAIPGFMNEMTMPFTLKDRNSLEDVHPGDEVLGTLRVERESGEVKDYELTDLVVSRPAPAPTLTLNFSGGQTELKTAPTILQPGDMVPDFAMTTQDGTTLRLSDLRGKVVALTFIFTRCPLPDFCPRMDRKFAQLAERVAAVPGRAGKIRLLSVSFDPEHDTPAILEKHALSQGARPPLWTFAVATHAELVKVAPSLGLVYGPGKEGIIHNLSAAVIDPDGRLVRLETGKTAGTWEPVDMLKTIYSRIPPREK